MTLNGAVALVTGGARRIGRAIALALASRGAHVIISYRRSAAEAAAAVSACERAGAASSLAVRADLERPGDVQRLFARIRQRHGRLDVLINSAARFERIPFGRLSVAQWDRTINANLRGPFLCALHASRLMARHGKIINLADWAGVRPYRDYLPYVVSKAGVIGLTKALAKELAPRVQVIAVAPGPMLPPADMSAAQRRHIARRVPLARWGSPGDIANTVVFLIEGTDFITGSTVFVDGGQLIA